MMKVLLVDDEAITLRMLKSLIPWEKLELELLGCAQDGEEAYKMVLHQTPDIIITDIRMNHMDGLELAKKVNEISPYVKIILMSAYADFGYVKHAIDLGCSSYILKPLDEAELHQSLTKIVDEIRGKEYHKKTIDRSEEQLRMLELYKYMRSGNGINQVIRHQKEYGIQFQDYYVILVQQNSGSINEYMNTSGLDMMQERYVIHLLEEMIAKRFCKKMVALDYEDDTWLVILEDAFIQEVAEICDAIIKDFIQNLDFHVITCFSRKGHTLQELPLLYQQVKHLKEYDFYIGEEQILGYDYNCVEQEIDQVRKIGLMKEAEQAVAVGDVPHLEEILEETFQISMLYQPEALHDIYEFCTKLLYCIKKNLESAGLQADVQEEELTKYDLSYEQVKQYHSLKQLKTLMNDAVRLLKKVYRGNIQKKYSPPVEQSVHIMEKHYGQNLSLQDICSSIALSKNYFCYLFKREVGVSPWNYLTQVRLRYAKQMLEETDMKTYEIAFKVGYDNPSYFSKIFKKIEGVTPNEYRECRR